MGSRARLKARRKARTSTETLYFAYGSNMNREQMLRRCPDATPLGAFTMPNWKLVFRGVADVRRAHDSECGGVLWRITAACEAALDRYEGYPHLYRKAYVSARDRRTGRGTEIMLYVMNRNRVAPPSPRYLESILEGCADFGLATDHVHAAVEASLRGRR